VRGENSWPADHTCPGPPARRNPAAGDSEGERGLGARAVTAAMGDGSGREGTACRTPRPVAAVPGTGTGRRRSAGNNVAPVTPAPATPARARVPAIVPGCPGAAPACAALDRRATEGGATNGATLNGLPGEPTEVVGPNGTSDGSGVPAVGGVEDVTPDPTGMLAGALTLGDDPAGAPNPEARPAAGAGGSVQATASGP